MRWLAGLVCSCLLVAGCAAESYQAARETAGEATEAASPSLQAEAAGEQAGRVEGVKPRIIYTAEIRLVAEDFAAGQEGLTALVEQVGGYVASASLDRTSGASRHGSWTVRVPVAQYDAFLASLDGIGFVESRDQRSEDVTMEYVDVDARIANHQRLEQRYVTLLAEQTGKLEDVLKVEQELARVRGEIEQAQGRLRYLTNKTDYATVTVWIREQKDYVPPKAPTFGERIAVTWSQSLTALREAGELAVLALVALSPWLAVASVPVLLVAVTIRLAIRRRSRRAASL